MNSACSIDQVLTPQDRDSLTARGTSLEVIERQLATFRAGIPFTTIAKPCTIEDGIEQIGQGDFPELKKTYQQAMGEGRVTKFVPASGAASRMFKSLLACCPSGDNTTTSPSASDLSVLHQFLKNLTRFPFFDDLWATLCLSPGTIPRNVDPENYGPILKGLLHEGGLNYTRQPKGLLKFHRYPDHARTPIEEHLMEAAAYAKDRTHRAQVHFTVSPEHLEAVQAHIESARQRFTQSDIDWIVTCSLQNASTDTIAVDLNNQPFRDTKGQLLFRPGGHGALLSNLNDLQADIVFIKNIDNVVPDHLREETYIYKQALGGLLVTIQRTLFEYLQQLESKNVTAAQMDDMMEWARSTLYGAKPSEWKDFDNTQRTQYLQRFFNRPIRACGMVKNTGDPGGGPFWVKHADGSLSLQIVESSQVDPHSAEQQRLFASSTHFNPVDMVCGVRDYTGKPFDLEVYVDPNTGFISQKSYEGRDLKALELPGLWNGAMAKWHTIFVEVPRETFNPVKTVLDLLLPAHQPQECE